MSIQPGLPVVQELIIIRASFTHDYANLDDQLYDHPINKCGMDELMNGKRFLLIESRQEELICKDFQKFNTWPFLPQKCLTLLETEMSLHRPYAQ